MARTARGAHMLSGGSGLEMPLDGLRVLLLDDDPSILRAIGLFLSSTGALVTKARSASEAFVAFIRERPHVIIADYAMPDTTGAEFLRQVRTCPAEADAPTPAILFSALPGLGAMARAAGFASYLVKPLEPDVLVAEIVRLAKT
jgi:CheY-like chemotaxis protein